MTSQVLATLGRVAVALQAGHAMRSHTAAWGPQPTPAQGGTASCHSTRVPRPCRELSKCGVNGHCYRRAAIDRRAVTDGPVDIHA